MKIKYNKKKRIIKEDKETWHDFFCLKPKIIKTVDFDCFIWLSFIERRLRKYMNPGQNKWEYRLK